MLGYGRSPKENVPQPGRMLYNGCESAPPLVQKTIPTTPSLTELTLGNRATACCLDARLVCDETRTIRHV